ncbi:hypothetical protein [Sphingosinicella rhizophila]|uniref:Cytochrome c domain-containing protein n=1 Tax=Sphingosinicella rhizophila TaxID=3050082 RepID=A0ABU3Q8U2_9SPHN|nr:hypothetical protein [Sphingosinicella sp. GR2756]MDT9599828.1 hypothetical protein [Sphingosinicella sp. GR2756]
MKPWLKPCRLLFLAPALLLAPVLSACQQRSVAEAGLRSPAPAFAQAPAFAETSCGRCHAVAPNRLSPNPAAPPFDLIVNKPGLTSETLSVWLRDAHNYPEEMAFALDPRQVDELVAYMLTLQDPDFRPPT